MSYLRTLTAVAAFAAGAGCLAAAGAQTPPASQVTKSAAEKIALHAVGGGSVQSERMGMRGTEQVYSVDVNVKGKDDIVLVNVDPRTGKVLDITYAGPRT